MLFGPLHRGLRTNLQVYNYVYTFVENRGGFSRWRRGYVLMSRRVPNVASPIEVEEGSKSNIPSKKKNDRHENNIYITKGKT